MARFFAWGAATFLMLTGAFLLWQGRAQNAGLPPAPKPRVATPFTVIPPTLPEAPASTPQDPRAAALRARRQGRRRADHIR